MSAPSQLEELKMRWEELRRSGQVVSARDVCQQLGCADSEELVGQLEHWIHQAATIGPSSDDGSNNDQTILPYDATLPTGDMPPPTWQSPSESPTGDEVIFSVSAYDFFRFHARGGLGEVFKAGDKDLGRDVALKFIRKEQEDDPNNKTQFLLEGEVTARLEHPGVVPIYGLGFTTDGRPFHVMRFIQGETLGDRIKSFHETAREGLTPSERRVQFRNLVSRLVVVCNTIGYAHNRGIVHRDIKPENVMLGKYGETLVVDWGLARPVARDERARASGEMTLKPGSTDTGSSFKDGIVGTPAYMSPEQAAGSSDIGPATDTYALGGLLYELLTDEPPVSGSHLREVLNKVQSGAIIRPREVQPRTPRALEAICLKAMSTTTEDRYTTAMDMAADLESWLAGEPVTVFDEPWKKRVVRWTQRHRSLSQAIAATVLVVLVSVTSWLTTNLNHREDLVNQRLESLTAEAAAQEAMLLSDFRNLELDVKFLASRPQLTELEGTAPDIATQAKQELIATFTAFIEQRPSYMQARFIDEDGMEIIRVQRDEPGGDISVQNDEDLRDKSRSQYYIDTKEMAEDQVYLSEVQLNVEDNIKDWDFPVIRAAAPVFSSGQRRLGIVIINMHFSDLAELVHASNKDDLLVYLTNDDGAFLLHPTEHIGFCFERDLVFPIKDTYPRLGVYFESDEKELRLKDVKPNTAVLVEWQGKSTGDGPNLYDAVKTASADYDQLDSRIADPAEGREMAILTGVDSSDAEEIAEQLEQDHGDQIKVDLLPPRYRTKKQAVYCRKIHFDNERPHRFITLILVLPY